MGIDFVLDTAKRIALFLLLVTLIAAAVISLLSALGGAATQALQAIGGFGLAPFFIPSNFTTVFGIALAVKTAGTVYLLALQLLGWKVDTLA